MGLVEIFPGGVGEGGGGSVGGTWVLVGIGEGQGDGIMGGGPG